MEVNSINSTKSIADYQRIDSIPILKNKEEKETEVTHGADKVSISDAAEKMMKYVRQVKEMEEIRPETIAEIKAKVHANLYPVPYIEKGLAVLIGN